MENNPEKIGYLICLQTGKMTRRNIIQFGETWGRGKYIYLANSMLQKQLVDMGDK